MVPYNSQKLQGYRQLCMPRDPTRVARQGPPPHPSPFPPQTGRAGETLGPIMSRETTRRLKIIESHGLDDHR